MSNAKVNLYDVRIVFYLYHCVLVTITTYAYIHTYTIHTFLHDDELIRKVVFERKKIHAACINEE